ncbi:MAG: hypothetical protein QOJ57_1370 [Thermoleophilaceae bacterium]|jgi:hypothetical protein|nr:hypothetical protein [Thermoleophilaceae bacterium]
MANTTVVVRYLTDDAEATRLLDALDAALEMPGDRLSSGRRYTLSSRTQIDRATAVAKLKSELDRISGGWPQHIEIHGIS